MDNLTGLSTFISQEKQTQLPLTIDYQAALALRQMALVQDELPKYLLAPEVSALLHYVPICTERYCWPLCGIPGRELMKRWR